MPLLVVNTGAEPLICSGNYINMCDSISVKTKNPFFSSENQATGKISRGLVTLK